MKHDPVVIIGMARTPLGDFLGELKQFSAVQLGAAAIQEAITRANLSLQDPAIQEVIMGCVLQAGQRQAPARQAALQAGLSVHVPAMTLNKVCGSGMKALFLAHDALLLNQDEVAVYIAGGMESMSGAPYLLSKAREGYRAGHGELKDHLFLDGLEDAYEGHHLMGYFAEQTAKHYNFSREMQDHFAITSLARAQKATQLNYFKQEIIAINTIETDEHPRKVNAEKIPLLKPVFDKEKGTITAANASALSDGAAALVLTRLSTAEKKGLQPLAILKNYSAHAHDPAWFTTAPIHAIQKLYQKTGWSDKDVDLYEINEAFAVVTLAAMKDLKLPHEKVNIHGGACALGHPIGATGARMVVSLISALKTHGLKKGIASLCIGGGEALAVALETPE